MSAIEGKADMRGCMRLKDASGPLRRALQKPRFQPGGREIQKSPQL